MTFGGSGHCFGSYEFLDRVAGVVAPGQGLGLDLLALAMACSRPFGSVVARQLDVMN